MVQVSGSAVATGTREWQMFNSFPDPLNVKACDQRRPMQCQMRNALRANGQHRARVIVGPSNLFHHDQNIRPAEWS